MRFLSLASLALFATAALNAVETPVNAVCPMSGKPINPALGCVPVKMGDGPDAVTLQVGTCSKECADMLVADGKKYRVGVWATLKDNGQKPLVKSFTPAEIQEACCNVKCPVDGKPVNLALKPLPWKFSESPKNPKSGKPVLIAFCSEECMDTFKKNPGKYEEALWLQEKDKLVK